MATIKQQEVLDLLVEALVAAQDHLEWCGYGDRYEAECAADAGLPELIDRALKQAGVTR